MNIILLLDCYDLRGQWVQRRKKKVSFLFLGCRPGQGQSFEIGSVCHWHPATSFALLHLKALKLGHRQPVLCAVYPAMILHPDLPFLLSVSSSKYTYLTSPSEHPPPPTQAPFLGIATANRVKRKAIVLLIHIKS